MQTTAALSAIFTLLALVFAAPQLYWTWRMCYRLRANSTATGFVGLPFKWVSLKHATGRIVSVGGHTETTTTTTYEDGNFAGRSVNSHHMRTYLMQSQGQQWQFKLKDYSLVGHRGQVVSFWYITRFGRTLPVAAINHSDGARRSFTNRQDLFSVLQPAQIVGMFYVLPGLATVTLLGWLGHVFVVPALYSLSMIVWGFGQARARRYFRKKGMLAMWRVGEREAQGLTY